MDNCSVQLCVTTWTAYHKWCKFQKMPYQLRNTSYLCQTEQRTEIREILWFTGNDSYNERNSCTFSRKRNFLIEHLSAAHFVLCIIYHIFSLSLLISIFPLKHIRQNVLVPTLTMTLKGQEQHNKDWKTLLLWKEMRTCFIWNMFKVVI